MDYQERLDRLAERHEALSQTVEIIAGMQRQNEERIEKLLVIVERMTDSLNRVVQLVENHERRIQRLEDEDQR